MKVAFCSALAILASGSSLLAQDAGKFELIDAGEGRVVGPLKNGSKVSPELARKNLNVAFRFEGAASVKLELSGPVSVSRTENEAPFTLFGDNDGKFDGRRLSAGSYQLSASAFSKPKGEGNGLAAQKIRFTIQGKAKAAFSIFELHREFPKEADEGTSPDVTLSGSQRQWEPITLTKTGIGASESDESNPFTDRTMAVRFRHLESGDSRIVYGFFAADGDAANSGADAGNRWQARFVPDRPGKWTYEVAMAHESETKGRVVLLPTKVEFKIEHAAKDARGMLRHEPGSRYLTWTGTGEVFLKGGADSPENFLAYADFDGTEDSGGHGKDEKSRFLHRYEPHVRDWKEGDPTWKDGKGKGMIGALNYLAGKGMNSVYMIPFNVAGGDGKDTWPWTGPEVRDRFDVSKLEQWNFVFDHMDRLGLAIHLILQEQENDQALDGGDLGPERKLYLRELVARFAHHQGIIWNLGEENTNSTSQQKAMADYIREIDPCDHPIVVHTFPPKKEQIYRPLLGHKTIDGPSLQVGRRETHSETVKWLRRSKEAGHPWFVCHDEVGPANRGVDPDSRKGGNNQKEIVREALWGNLLAGGSGAEWYFGYENPHSDLNCEDWRSRDRLWDYTRYALEFFRELPMADMKSRDQLTNRDDAWCFAKPGEVYVVYIRAGAAPKLDLSREKKDLTMRFYDPFEGTWERVTVTIRAEAGKVREIRRADPSRDMVCVLKSEW